MTQTVVEQLRDSMVRCPATERRVAHRLLADYPMAGLQSATELARAVGVSTPTVLRLVTRLGFGAYADFQRRLREELAAQLSSPLTKDQGVPASADRPDADDRLGGFAAALMQNLSDTFANLVRDELDQVAAALADRRLRIHLVGGRFSDALARYLAVQLRILRPAVNHLQDQEANWHDQLLDMDQRDLLLIFDIRRYQPSLLRLARLAALRKVRIVLLTDQWLSPVAQVARHVLPARVTVPSVWDSTVALLALSEYLLAEVARADRDFSRQRIGDLEQLREAAPDHFMHKM